MTSSVHRAPITIYLQGDCMHQASLIPHFPVSFSGHFPLVKKKVIWVSREGKQVSCRSVSIQLELHCLNLLGCGSHITSAQCIESTLISPKNPRSCRSLGGLGIVALGVVNYSCQDFSGEVKTLHLK